MSTLLSMRSDSNFAQPSRSRRPVTRARASGITLVEVVITLLVLAILSAFAVNGYNSFVRRARAGDAIEQLDHYRTRMEKAFQDNGNYGTGSCAVTLPTSVAQFAYACTLSSGNQAFMATATGLGSMTGYQFSINEQGLRRTLAFPSATIPADCFMVEKNRCQ